MSAVKHTPGPWVATPDPLGCETDWMVGASDGHPDGVAVCNKRDARLIAAAPELLEALQIARDFAAYAQAEPADLALIDAAIAKATGEQA